MSAARDEARAAYAELLAAAVEHAGKPDDVRAEGRLGRAAVRYAEARTALGSHIEALACVASDVAREAAPMTTAADWIPSSPFIGQRP